MDSIQKIRNRISDLKLQHGSLKLVISKGNLKPNMTQAFKRKKLRIKDQIAKLKRDLEKLEEQTEIERAVKNSPLYTDMMRNHQAMPV